jgi:hypothetical protein
MNNTRRGLLAAGLIITTSLAESAWWALSQPDRATHVAVAQVNGGEAAWRDLLAWQTFHQWPGFLAEGIVAIILGWWAAPYVAASVRMLAASRARRITRVLPLVAVAFASGGCVKPFDKPEYVEIDTSETGFLIPLEGDSTQQARFESVDYLQERKVAAKRIQITHRWNQEGRISNDGRWLPLVRLVKVNRSPLTREWTSEGKHESGDKAIWIESADSVGFSMGFTCTAFIDEKDAATFLYWYPSGSLATVMDSEMRGRVQQTAAEIAAKYPLDDLRTRKQEIADAVKKDVMTFFSQRGITVTTVGMFGGMTYENAAIQKAIDETVIAQQLKVVSEAKFSAQQRENDRIELEAKATAEKYRLEAKGKSDARLAEAEAEAKASIAKAQAESEGIRLVNDAVAGSNPMLLQMRQMDVEKARIERWNGAFPQMMLGNNPNILFTSQLPVLTQPKP